MKSGPDDAERAASEALLAKPKAPVLLTDMTIDEYNDRVIETADHFVATKFIGMGRYDTKHGIKTLEEALAYAREQLGHGALVYAVDARGRHALAGTVPYPAKSGGLKSVILRVIEEHHDRAKLANLHWFYGRVMMLTGGKANNWVLSVLLKRYLREFEENGVIG